MRMQYHFEPQKGWINDPNGLVFFQGKYHAFFQHYPYGAYWGQMHWGHAVSEDLIHWEELPIALFPDKPYEDSGGCFSGSAVVKDGRLYLFYTSVSESLGQTQSVAFSDDGLHFEKYENNPVIRQYPMDGSVDFRDPKVTLIGDAYYMVCGSGKDGVGKILLFKSANLFDWEYAGVLLSGTEYGGILECPDFFPFQDKYLLYFSQMGRYTHSTCFIYGDFDGTRFTPIWSQAPEAGPHFYAPQSFQDPSGRRIMIGWTFPPDRKPCGGADYVGAFSIPRELSLCGGKLCSFPVSEAQPLLVTKDKSVNVDSDGVTVRVSGDTSPLRYHGEVRQLDILRDVNSLEVFINRGEASFTCWT